jgi:hypothetical protein
MPMGFVEMMVRGAFLDGRVYRQAALDVNGNGGAILALVIPFLAASVGTYLWTFAFGFGRLFGLYSVYTMGIGAAIGILAAVVALFVMAALSQTITGWKLGLGQLFRALAYAQSPGIFGLFQ